MTQRILVTGSDGFTGRHFCRLARESGFDIIELKADLRSADAVRAEVAATAVEYVVHLAALSAVTHADVFALYQVNLFGTLNLLQALHDTQQQPQRILLVSSANVYGDCTQSPIAEQLPPAPVNHYAMSKLAMEHLAKTHADTLPLLFVRPFNYTGVGHDDRFVIPKIVDHFARGCSEISLGNVDVIREFNDVRVICDAYFRLLKQGVCGETYNVCSGQAYSLRQAINALEEQTGRCMTVKKNEKLYRANEIRELYGSPDKLEACVGKLPHPGLDTTLKWMLESALRESDS